MCYSGLTSQYSTALGLGNSDIFYLVFLLASKRGQAIRENVCVGCSGLGARGSGLGAPKVLVIGAT